MIRLVRALRAALEAESLLHQPLLCAVSGGADSVALLHAAHALQKECAFPLFAVHVQHNLRGEDSLADEQFVRELCHTLSVPLSVEDAGLAGSMEDAGIETRAREARREIFAREMRQTGAKVLLTAHHRDDQTETVLMHLLRGSGMRGLSGIARCAPFAEGFVLRPFLSLSKADILDALQSAGLPHREDGSNQHPVTPRNALRLELLPKLESLFPGASALAAQLADIVREDDRFLDQQAEPLYRAALYDDPPLFALNRQVLQKAPPALLRRIFRRWYADGLQLANLAPQERALSYADTLALADCLVSGQSVNLPCDLMAMTERTHIHLLRQGGEPLVPAEAVRPIPIHAGMAELRLPHLMLRMEPASADAPLPQTPHEILLPPAVLAQSPVLRHPLPEDRIHPFGAPGSKPLRRYLPDCKVDAPFRPVLPVVAIGPEVVWIPSLCTAEALRMRDVPPGALRLTVTKPIPFLPKYPKE